MTKLVIYPERKLAAMSSHRFQQLFVAPQQVAAPASPSGSAWCILPVVFVAQPLAWQQHVYMLAYEQARAAAAETSFHKRLFCCWN